MFSGLALKSNADSAKAKAIAARAAVKKSRELAASANLAYSG